jgi:hypothetical protein
MDQRKETDDVAGAAAPGEEACPDTTRDPFTADAVEDDAVDRETATRPAPAEVAELAAACVRFVGTRYGVALDFHSETLSFVDQWVRDARAEVRQRPEAVDLVQGAAGAYLGEVIRRTFGGSWIAGRERPHPDWRLCLTTVYCAFNPIGMAREALVHEPADGFGAHFELDPAEREAVEARLDALPAVEDDEYYAPSTRFDVVSIVVDALRAAMKERGLSDVRFGTEDYA